MAVESKNNVIITRRQALALTGGALVASSVIARGASASPVPGASAQAKLTQVRNATLRIDYGGVRFLVDPLLAEKGAYPGFEGTANSHLRNPLVPLPMPLEDIINVDAVIVTHLHSDHWDDAAKARLPKSLPLFAQDEQDAAQIRSAGFTDVRVLTETSEFNGVKLSKTGGQHGTDAAIRAAGKVLGQVCGVVFSHTSTERCFSQDFDDLCIHARGRAVAWEKPLICADSSPFATQPDEPYGFIMEVDGKPLRLRPKPS